MLFEALDHLFRLDIAFFIDWFSGSIFLIFAFYVLMHFFSNGKNVLRNTVLFILTMFAWVQFQDLSGIMIMGAAFLSLNYILKLFVLKVGESTPSLSGRLILINEFSGILLMIIFALGLIG
ncbi:MAG: hypothetical protein ABIA76_02210 [Candidatus Diapherotrites archaeon]